MANKSLYSDRANKKTAKMTATDFIMQQKSDGSESTKGAQADLVLATELNPMSAPISTTYKALPFNPLRGRAVVANSENTKAYGVRPVDLGQESVAIRRNSASVKVTIPSASWEYLKPTNNSFSFGLYLPKYPLDTNLPIRLLHFDDRTDISGFRCLLQDASGGRGIAIDLYKAGVIASSTPTLLGVKRVNENPYFHCVINRETNKILYYIDGVLHKTGTIDDPTWTCEVTGIDLSLYGGVNFSSGIMNSFMWFNYALSASDVAYYWNNGRPDLAIIRDSDKWGNKTKYSSTYAGNEVLDAVSWYYGNATALMPVGLKRPNSIGLYDMNGNVWELCWDWFGETYPTGANNPTGAMSGSHRVIRGGSWYSNSNDCRVARRISGNPGYSDDYLGFRLCRKYSASLLANDVVVQAKTAGMQAIGLGTYTDCTIDSFLMQKYVVTEADMKPKVNINWYNACKYANQKSSANGLDKCYHVVNNYDENSWGDTPAIECNFSKSGYRLPTEAEWEWAARQGSAGSVADYSPASIADPVMTGSVLTSITAGNTYEVNDTALGANQINPAHADYVGANDTAIGTQFVATRTGAIGTGKVKLLAVTSWLDNSTNALNATVSGNPMLVKTQVEEKQGDGIKAEIQTVLNSVHTVLTPTVSVPANHVIESIVIKNTGANAITSFKAGVGAGEEVIALDSSSLASGASRAYFAKSPVTCFKETEAVTITLTAVQASTYAWESTVTFRRVK